MSLYECMHLEIDFFLFYCSTKKNGYWKTRKKNRKVETDRKCVLMS